jgi:hypothetical protein
MLKKFLLGQYSLKISLCVHFGIYFGNIGLLYVLNLFNFVNFFWIFEFIFTLVFSMIGLLNSSIKYIKEKKIKKQSAVGGYSSILWIIFLSFMAIKGAIFN